MQILITGAAGFIGSNLSRHLLKYGNTVLGLDNLITGDSSNLAGLKKHPRFIFFKHDITKPAPRKFMAKTTKIKLIYHLACPTGIPNLIPLAEEMLRTSAEGTRNVLELARQTKARLLFTSSSEVYGNPQVSPQSEDYTGNVDPTGIRSPYEEGKRFAESLVMMYVRKYKLRATIVRVFNTYGPGMTQNDTRVIPRFIYQALNNMPLTIHGTGNQTRTFCYIDDVIDGLMKVMKKGLRGEIYNLGNQRETTILEVAKLVCHLTRSQSKIVYAERPSHDHQRRQPDLTRVRRLGWSPVTTLTQGLKLTLKQMGEK